ncbi:hypothetical protein BDY19DRAFT_685987 [Irpex rosettiformis]|uniref:Uncharacterized protein n=1 Tax=Irpex rosettiformis TaxID=378272 RepID=A0ACB8UAF4_9APHY|nr:hypothetical protein BDY19DRAFT_685987 [Irpex rosettiformis]
MANAPTADVIEPVQLGTQAPPEKEKEKEASVTHEEHTDVVHVIEPSSMEDAPLLLPSLLHVTAGSRTPDVIEVVFEVNKALADASRRWSAGQASYDASSSYASVYLLCLPMEKVKSIHERIGLTASAEEYGDALWNIQTAWPPQGKLVIEMNSNKATHTTFVPQQLIHTYRARGMGL